MRATLLARLAPLETLEHHRPAWQALAREALEPNPFYAPDFLLPLVRTLDKPGRVKALTLWRRDTPGQEETLVGFLPLHRPNWREGLPLGVISAYWNPYICLTTPLIARDRPEETLSALFAQLDQETGSTQGLSFPALPLHRDIGRLMSRVLMQEGRANIILSHYARATLTPLPGTGLRDYVAQESADARKSFRRREIRLMAVGQIEYAAFSTPGEDRARALQQFLTLEASGWKGRHRTALNCKAGTRAFIAQAFAGDTTLAYEVERLTVDSIPIAMSLNLVSHGVLHNFKQAYDETWRSFAPGKLLDRQAIRRVVESPSPLSYDSCAYPGYPIEDIWHERLVIAHKLVAIGKSPRLEKLETIARRAMCIQHLFRKLKLWRKALRGSSAPRSAQPQKA